MHDGLFVPGMKCETYRMKDKLKRTKIDRVHVRGGSGRGLLLL